MYKGSEIIEKVGKILFKGFDLTPEPRYSIYKSVFESMIRRLEKQNSEKGILLVGNIGVGKTLMMRIMQKIFKDTPGGFVWVNCHEIPDLLETNTTIVLKEWWGKGLKKDLYLDDIGIGNSLYNKYGQSFNILADIIMERYELYVTEGFKTHISTNKPTSLDKSLFPNITTLEDLYGDRIIDRLREMCVRIVWEDKSLRS